MLPLSGTRHAIDVCMCVEQQSHQHGLAHATRANNCMYVCIYVCMYVCMHRCIGLAHSTRAQNCMYVCMYVCMWVYVCMCTRMHVCMYVCMYLCMYIYIYIYVCIHVNTYMYAPEHGMAHPTSNHRSFFRETVERNRQYICARLSLRFCAGKQDAFAPIVYEN